MTARYLIVLAAALLIAGSPASFADTMVFDFTLEMDGHGTNDYAQMTITEQGGSLAISIVVNGALGPRADLHAFYFSLTDGVTGLRIFSTDPQHNKGMYALEADPSISGGAGAAFDFGVNFGDGAGPPGNGTLQHATFVLSADQPLLISMLLAQATQGNNVSEPVYFAAHFQGTSAFPGADSETIGATWQDLVVTSVPLPGAFWLMGIALAMLAGARRRAPP